MVGMFATSLISGFIAKESVVSTLEVLLGGTAISGLFTTRSALSFLVFTLLYTPCVAAVATIRRELDSSLKTLGVVAMQCGVAWLASLAIYAIAGYRRCSKGLISIIKQNHFSGGDLMAVKNVTIQDIADRLGMAKSTVSKAISGATDISEKTRERVLACAGEMGYQVKAKHVSYTKSIVVFIYGSIHYDKVDQFGYEIILGLQAAAAEHGIGVNITAISNAELKSGNYYSIVSGGNCEGAVFLGFKPHHVFIEHIRSLNIPLVILDNNVDYQLAARVGCDSAEGIRQMVQYLWMRGHDRIGFLGGEEDSIVTQERYQAYSDALKELGLEENKDAVRYGHFSAKGTRKRILPIAQTGVTAVVCISDLLACSAVQELEKAGYVVPTDISVTGYDNLPVSEYSQPRITTMYQNRIHIGKTAFVMLQQMNSGISIEAVSLRPELIERESVKLIAKRILPEEDK